MSTGPQDRQNGDIFQHQQVEDIFGSELGDGSAAESAERADRGPGPASQRFREPKKNNGGFQQLWLALAAVGLCAALCLGIWYLFFRHTHLWVDATCKAPRTCSACDATDGIPLGHRWQEATCEEAGRCISCGKTEGEPLGHDWQGASCVNPGSCAVCGESQGAAAGHMWSPATRTDPKTCVECAQTMGSAATVPLVSGRMTESSNEANSTSDVAVGAWTDCYGVQWPQSLKFWVMDKSGWSNTEYAVFALSEPYETLVGTVVLEKGSEPGSEASVRIYADGVLVYESGRVDKDTGAAAFSVDISGAKALMVECVTDSAASTYCILDAYLSLA